MKRVEHKHVSVYQYTDICQLCLKMAGMKQLSLLNCRQISAWQWLIFQEKRRIF